MLFSGIERFVVRRRIAPAFDGKEFGSAGQYELIFGEAHGVIDPDAAYNSSIAELDKAQRCSDGAVRYSTDVAILAPIDRTRSSGILAFEVINRSIASVDTDGTMAAGTLNMVEFLLQRGDIYVAAAWQGDLAPSTDQVPAQVREVMGGAGLYANLPLALEGGRPLVRRIKKEVAVWEPTGLTALPFIRLPYPAAGPGIEVYARAYEADVPRLRGADTVRLIDADSVWIEADPAAMLYDVVYDATNSPVSGIGLAIPRDLVSFLRYEIGGEERINPLLDAAGNISVRHAYAYGVSQSGRYLRVFVGCGFNEDARGRSVFDGIVPMLGGGKKGSFNCLFATPGMIPGPQTLHRMPDLFPFAYPVLLDPLSNRSDGLLAAYEDGRGRPKIIQLDTENEVVEGFGWLLTTAPDGQPIEQPPNIRLYCVAGAEHGPGGWRPGAPYTRAELCSPVPVLPFMKAVLSLMARWIVDGVEPPASRYPSLADGTLVPLDEAERNWPRIPDKPFTRVRNIAECWDEAFPWSRSRGRYPLLTVPLDADGNSIVGLRHPIFAVPTATIASVTCRRPEYSPQDMAMFQGEAIPFARTLRERIANGDSRPSLEERYPGGPTELAQRRRAAADALIADGFLLPEDVDGETLGSLDEALEALSNCLGDPLDDGGCGGGSSGTT